jgi:predicted ribosomally synthesized peptide with nif11-like leader
MINKFLGGLKQMAGMKELQQKFESDKAFAESLQNAADAKELFLKIKDAGFEVTPEELADSFDAAEGELDDDSLEAVAGGASVWVTEMRKKWDLIGGRVDPFFGDIVYDPNASNGKINDVINIIK